MKNKIFKLVIFFYKYYLILLPFIAYVGVIFLDPSLCGQLSFFGWLPVAMYYYFFQLKYNLLKPSVANIILRFLPLLIIGLMQSIIKNGSVWSFFVSAFIYEICTLTLALSLLLFYNLKKKQEIVIIILAALFLGVSALFTIMALFLALNQSSPSLLVMVSIIGAIIVDLISEIDFIQGIILRKVALADIAQSDAKFEKNMLWFIFAIFMWGLGMLFIKGIIN